VFDEAQGYLELEMFEEAILALNRLHPDLVASPAGLRIVIRAAAGLEKWDMAYDVAKLLREGNRDDRIEAGCCFHSIAAHHFQHGRDAEARAMIEQAIAANPDQRTHIMDDPRLAGLVFPEGD
jgi:tetratricopeptide (TPR) repeat protein